MERTASVELEVPEGVLFFAKAAQEHVCFSPLRGVKGGSFASVAPLEFTLGEIIAVTDKEGETWLEGFRAQDPQHRRGWFKSSLVRKVVLKGPRPVKSPPPQQTTPSPELVPPRPACRSAVFLQRGLK